MRFTNTTHTTASIEWRISQISYTPEIYYVKYGTSSTSLTLNTTTIESGSDVSITNQIYSVELRGLTFNTTYYYQVVASNSIGSSYSSVKSFVTVSLSKLTCIDHGSENYKYHFHIAVVVLVRAQGVPRTGEIYQLTCTATRAVNTTNLPTTVTWIGPNGQIISNGSGIALNPFKVNSTTTTSVLTFSPLAVVHEGDYTCLAAIGATQNSYLYTVTVESK